MARAVSECITMCYYVLCLYVIMYFLNVWLVARAQRGWAPEKVEYMVAELACVRMCGWLSEWDQRRGVTWLRVLD